MLAIIAHHYVVNSGVIELIAPGFTVNTLFLELWGMWGKAAINAFVLVTGYFMCTSRLTWLKVFNLVSEVVLYSLVIYIVLAVLGYQAVTLGELLFIFFGLFKYIGGGFTPSFLAFYLLIPFLNALISTLGQKGLDRLLALLLGIFVVTVTFFKGSAFNEVGWYAALYLLAARVRLFPSRLTEEPVLSRNYFAISILLSVLSVAVLGILSSALGREGIGFAYYFMSDSSKLLAFSSGFSCFLFFKNLSMPHSHLINRVASTTFGVLLIHASSDAMRRFLWNELLDVPGAYAASLPLLVLHASLSAVSVFVVCSIIDFARQAVIEKPLMGWVVTHREANEERKCSLCHAAESHFEKVLCVLRPLKR